MTATPEELYEKARAAAPDPDEFDRKFGASFGHGPKPEPSITFDPDLVPEVEYERKPEQDELDRVIDGIDILDAYAKWCGKSIPKSTSRNEVQVSCPIPGHADANPSASINTEKEVWQCYACEMGGDKYDIAAYHFGYNVPGYKKDGSFPQLRADMAADYGYTVKRTMGGETFVVGPDEPPPESDKSAGQSSTVGSSSAPEPPDKPELRVTSEEPLDAPVIDPNNTAQADIFIDWENIVPQETFLDEWMTTVAVDDLPHEYYFWEGLQALAFSVGDGTILADLRPVKSNIYVCTYGGTGSGKTRATYPYLDLLRTALPFEYEPSEPCRGTKILPSPGSAESLLDMFGYDLLDTEMKKIGNAPVRGLVKIEEFSSFIARASRPGAAFKEILMELYDAYKNEVTHHTRGSGLTIARDPFCQMITTTQPNAIHAFLNRNDTETGFLNRWVFAAGTRRREHIAHGGTMPDVSGPADMLRAVHRWARPERTMRLEGPALEVWEAFFFGNIAPLKDNLELDSMFSRIDLTLKKLILLFTINMKLDHPTPETVQMATALFPYLHKTYSAFTRDLGVSPESNCQVRIIQIIKDHYLIMGEWPSKRQIVQRLNKKFQLDMVQKQLKVLVEMETIISKVNKPARGPSTERFELPKGEYVEATD